MAKSVDVKPCVHSRFTVKILTVSEMVCPKICPYDSVMVVVHRVCNWLIMASLLVMAYYLVYLTTSFFALFLHFSYLQPLLLMVDIFLFYWITPRIVRFVTHRINPLALTRQQLILNISKHLFRLHSVAALNEFLEVSSIRFDPNPHISDYGCDIYSTSGCFLGSLQFTSEDTRFIQDIIEQIREPLENILLIDTLQSQYDALKHSQLQLIEHERHHVIAQERERHLREVSCLITGTIHIILNDIDQGLTQIRQVPDDRHSPIYADLKEKCLTLCHSAKSFLQSELHRMESK